MSTYLSLKQDMNQPWLAQKYAGLFLYTHFK